MCRSISDLFKEKINEGRTPLSERVCAGRCSGGGVFAGMVANTPLTPLIPIAIGREPKDPGLKPGPLPSFSNAKHHILTNCSYFHP